MSSGNGIQMEVYGQHNNTWQEKRDNGRSDWVDWAKIDQALRPQRFFFLYFLKKKKKSFHDRDQIEMLFEQWDTLDFENQLFLVVKKDWAKTDQALRPQRFFLLYFL